MTAWLNVLDVPEEAHLVQVDGEWAISDDPALPEIGRALLQEDSEILLDASSSIGGLPLVRRQASFFAIVEMED